MPSLDKFKIPSDAQQIRVEACKADASVHRAWDCFLIDENKEFWTFVGTFRDEISHPLLGVIRRGTISYEYYWKNRWYNVFRFHEPDGALRNFYCNINQPPILRGDVLSYIDLDIDVLVAADLTFQVVDLEEFAVNSRKYNYSPEILRSAADALREVTGLITARQFPFDFVA